MTDPSVFEVDPVMGFMAPRPPPARLPAEFQLWETALDDAVGQKIQLGDSLGLSEHDKTTSKLWRAGVKMIPLLSIDSLKHSKPLLRRAHLVLTYIQHFYLQSLPPDQDTILPRSISLPLLRVSAALGIPPLLTYSDTVLYNWRIEPPSSLPSFSQPDPSQLRSQTTFTNTVDEEEFYLCSARIELRGVEALKVMRVIRDEMFVDDIAAVRRVTGYLAKLANVIDELKGLLEDVKKKCDPDRYYNDVRPWFRGQDSDGASVGYFSDTQARKWVFEGIEEDPELEHPTELSGPSAGQSSIIHVLDLFLGVDHNDSSSSPSSPSPPPPSFMTRMKIYMPYHHRLFIDHLASHPPTLRSFVLVHDRNDQLKNAYNHAVRALKGFRDAHMIIAALYILGPARRTREAANEALIKEKEMPLKGTGGTDLVHFLKDTRTRTVNTLIP
ncbi:Indoleamine 2,3-dioxygenase [Amanita muscaria]